MRTIHRLCHLCIGQNLPRVSIIRGKDGFGFTICCDSPVRVQSVEAGGPAHQSGLRPGDAVLQLNGLPVEIWKCGELAHAVRSCPGCIVLVVWRGSPEIRTCCETLVRPPAANKTAKLLRQPAHSKHGHHRRDQGSLVLSSLGVLGSLWKDHSKEEKEAQGGGGEEEEEEEEAAHCTSRLEDAGMTSSNGDNYIILSPIAPQVQLVHPVFEDRSRTIGRLYQTHPGSGLNLVGETPVGLPRQPIAQGPLTLVPPTPCFASSSTLRNYQNCTIIQSHPPSCHVDKPVDLCSPDRTLFMSEEMLLHQAQQLPRKVTVLIYNDILLVTQEDQAGRYQVLKSPLYINTLRLQEVVSAPRHIFFLQSSVNYWHCLFSLEAFSMDQKLRVSICLHDNIQQQLVSVETIHTLQVSSSPSELGLFPSPPSHPSLSIPQRTASPRPSPTASLPSPRLSPSPTLRPVWKDRVKGEEEDKRRWPQEDLGSASRPAGLRRCVSEGSIGEEAEWARWFSDSAVHRLSLGLRGRPPSVQSLKKHLTSEGVTLKHTLTLLQGAEDLEIGNDLRKKSKSFSTSDVRNRLLFLCRRKRSVQSDSLERALRNARPSAREVLMWAESLESLLANQYGLAVFRHFLRSEYSEENLDFWLAVEKFKETRPLSKMADRAAKIYEEFISCSAARQVKVDSSLRESTNRSLRLGVDPASFQLAQDQIFSLMEAESYPRFLRSRLYAQLANQNIGPAYQSQAVFAASRLERF
ncbi:regulator of G-protein signaling 3-like isoform X2 [Syngnathoides biaculeatus]|uniref:regulator of G-protein signaling 3-like isoform X2 n=1 Tax=Syngnathoides biaculeatus TaxID=300417 RepID=UPI002ADD9980|nr:regulator of G-protein signaling 3-like isoform X2 [Syngnathoides biaculeatus]